MKKTILIVHNHYQIPGGEDTVVSNEKDMLERNGYKVILYTKNNSDLNNLTLLQKIFFPFFMVFNPVVFREIKSIIKEQNVEIIHVHNTLVFISFSVYYAALRYHIPVVQTVHNFRLLCPAATLYRDGQICEECIKKGLACALIHKCYRNSTIQTLACVFNLLIHRFTRIFGKINYICLTDFNKEKLLNIKQIKKEQIFVKPNFVKIKRTFLIPEKRQKQYVYTGRLDSIKGINLLLEKWKVWGKAAPKLVICGTGPLEKWCREFIENNKINVELKGFISNSEVLDIIANSKGLIFPTQWYEGFPMSIVEAFSVGTPVICTNIGNCSSIIIDSVNGYKFDKIDDIPDYINRIERNYNIYGSTYDFFLKNYSEAENIKILERIYNNAKIFNI